MRKLVGLIFLVFLFSSCKSAPQAAQPASGQKVGVLLVSHGSHSKQWRDMLLDLEQKVQQPILADQKVSEVRSAFMEYDGPSIADQMRYFDGAGFDQVIVIPIFLTVSTHYLDDIPNILGLKSDPKVLEELKSEKIEVYRARTKTTITPPLDYTSFLKQNLLTRVEKELQGKEAGVVLVGYGDAQYNQQWEALMGDLGRYLQLKSKVGSVAFAWCGHLVHYSKEPTVQAIRKVLEVDDQVLVVPILVAYDPDFQEKIIGKAVSELADARILYTNDAILPDPQLNAWVIERIRETAALIW